MESGTIVRWLKSEGEAVEKGEPLFELDTDKVTQDVEAETSGVLLKIAVAEGEVPVGETVAFIGEQGEDVPDVSVVEVSAVEEAGARHQSAVEREVVDESRVPGTGSSQTNGQLKASPLARRLARERGIDLGSVG